VLAQKAVRVGDARAVRLRAQVQAFRESADDQVSAIGESARCHQWC
jgi:hypothetical protein